MLTKTLGFFAVLILFSLPSFSQSVGIGTANPDKNAALDVQSGPTPQGMYIPRLQATERIEMILNATNIGLLVYDLDSLAIMHWTGTNWNKLGASGSGIAKETVIEYYSIPASDFISYDTESNTFIAQKSNNGAILYQKGTSESFAGTGIHLPDGATITKITLFSKDLVANNITAELFRMNPDISTSPQKVATVASDNVSTGNQVSSTNFSSVVDNSKFMYWVQLQANASMGSTQNLGTYGVKITYSIQKVK